MFSCFRVCIPMFVCVAIWKFQTYFATACAHVMHGQWITIIICVGSKWSSSHVLCIPTYVPRKM